MSPNFNDKSHLIEFYDRMQSNAVIALDNHSNSYYLLDFLQCQDKHVSIVTFSTDIMKFVCQNTHFNIIFLPGKVHQAHHVITGHDVLDKIKTLHIHYYLCEASYIDQQDRLYQINPDVALIQKSLMAQSEETFLVNYPDSIKDVSLYSLIGELN